MTCQIIRKLYVKIFYSSVYFLIFRLELNSEKYSIFYFLVHFFLRCHSEKMAFGDIRLAPLCPIASLLSSTTMTMRSVPLISLSGLLEPTDHTWSGFHTFGSFPTHTSPLILRLTTSGALMKLGNGVKNTIGNFILNF